MALRFDLCDWDDDKARSNAVKHGVTFEDAMYAMFDPFWERFHIDVDFQDHSGEERIVTLARYPFSIGIVFAIVWTVRSEGSRSVCWIISARHASKVERMEYERQVYGR